MEPGGFGYTWERLLLFPSTEGRPFSACRSRRGALRRCRWLSPPRSDPFATQSRRTLPRLAAPAAAALHVEWI